MRKEIVQFVCDITGHPADETVEFGLDRDAYVIDLREDHANQLRLALAPYISAGRRANRTVMTTQGVYIPRPSSPLGP